MAMAGYMSTIGSKVLILAPGHWRTGTMGTIIFIRPQERTLPNYKQGILSLGQGIKTQSSAILEIINMAELFK